MQSLYATSFDVASVELDATLFQVAGDVSAWAWRGDGAAPDLIAAPSGHAPIVRGYRLSWSTLVVDDGPERVLDVVLRHPDSSRPELEWRTEVQLCRAVDRLSLTLRLARGSTSLALAPTPLTLRRPELVPRLLCAHSCTAGPLPLRSQPVRISADGASRLVREALLDPARALPVLVLAVPPGRTGPEVNAEVLADELAGLVHVYVLAGHLAWRRLGEELRDLPPVPQGGARLYWPGLDNRSGLRHPYWTRARLRDPEETLHRTLFVLLSRLSSAAVPPDPLVERLRRAQSEARRRDLERALDNHDSEMVEEFMTEFDETKLARDELRESVLDLSRQLANALEENAGHREAWAERPDTSPPAEEGDAGETLIEPTSWPEVVEAIEVLEGPAFALTDRARRMIIDNPYRDPGRMWEHLELLAAAADEWHSRDGELRARLKSWMHTEFGIEIALKDASLEGRDRFEFEGRTHSNQPHVKVDDYKDPASCGRIYFAKDDERKRFIVDHVGLHR